MKSFDYHSPSSHTETLELLSRLKGRKTRLLAGGTDMAVELKDGKHFPEVVVQLNLVKEYKGVRDRGDAIEFGPLATYQDVLESKLCRDHAEVLCMASLDVGSPQIRSMGTLAGNLATASPAGDAIPPLYALEAEVTLASVRGERIFPIDKFFLGYRKTELQPDEVIYKIRVPKTPKGQPSFWHKLGQRQAMAIAKVSVAARLALKKGAVEQAWIAYGAVGPVIYRARHTENYLAGKPFTEENIRAAAELVNKDITPITDLRSTAEYRRKMAVVILRRGLLRLKNSM